MKHNSLHVSSICLNITVDSGMVVKDDKQVGIKFEQETLVV